MYWTRIYEFSVMDNGHFLSYIGLNELFKKHDMAFFNLNLVNRYYNEKLWN